MSDLFYVFGLGLTVVALVVAFVGMRMENFPSARGPFMGVLTFMSFLVIGSCAFAIVLSREEQKHRREEVAEFRAEQAAEEEEEAGAEAGADADPEEPVQAQPTDSTTLDLTSPDGGDLVFDQGDLEATAGEVVLDYTNPSEVPHNVAIEAGSETVAQSETVTNGASASAMAQLEPGDYTYFCSIPGHRESGMFGALVVD